MRIGFDISKVLGVPDGLANYSRSLLCAMTRCAPHHEFRLFDLRQHRIDRERCTDRLSDLGGNAVVVDGRGPEPGEVEVFLAPAFKVPTLTTVPLVYTVHDVTFVSHPQFHTLHNRQEVLCETAEAVLRGAAFLAVSKATKKELTRWLGVRRSHVSVIHEAADPFYSPLEPGAHGSEVLDRLGVERPYVLAVGSIEPRKNLRGLLEAFAELDDDLRERHSLVVVGAAGWRNEEIHARLEELSHRVDLKFAGQLGRKELAELYGHARVFAYPSFAEGFGLPVLEAMACGAPVITSNCSSMPEVAGHAARLVDPKDRASIRRALDDLLRDSRARERAREAGLKRASEFSWTRAAEETLSLLDRVGYRRRAREVIAPSTSPEPWREPGYVSKLTACTIVSKNYLPFARTLAESFLEQHPNGRFVTLLVDRVDGCFDPAAEPFELVRVEDLTNIPNLESFLFKYTVLELNTAVKPYFLERLLGEENCEHLLYLDPDIFIYRPLAEIEKLLEEHPIVLIPHLTAPINAPGLPDELTILRAGTYNLGFLGISNTAVARDFLNWWQSRIYDNCVVRVEEGLFVDQKWVDLVPGLFEGVAIVRHPGYDVAYWNLHEREVTVAADGPRVNGEPLYFYHFSGIDPNAPKIISKHQTRFSWRDLGDARELFEEYAKAVLENDWNGTRSWTYAFGTFDNGVRIPDTVRRMYLDMGEGGSRFGNPFTADNSPSFFDWLNEPARPGRTQCVTRLQHALYRSRADLRLAFPDPLGEHLPALSEWLSVHAKSDFDLDDAWLESLEPVLDSGVPESLIRRTRRLAKRTYDSEFSRRLKDQAKRVFGEDRMKRLRRDVLGPPPPEPEAIENEVEDLKPGVNVAGYIKTESGVGEGVRTMIRCLRQAEVPHVLCNLEFNVVSRMDDESFTNFSDQPEYAINVFAVNADQVPEMVDCVGNEWLDERYNVGYWAWELDVFPEEWMGSFSHFQEIWTPSRFCVDVFSRVSPVPVRRVPHSVEISASPDASRQQFDLPEDRFLFLFAYDYLSFWQRKNPLGLVRAFRKAFEGREDVGLVLKSINSDRDMTRTVELRAKAAGLPVWHIDSYLSRQQVFDLMAVCDAYASLHRAEGFGLTLAEAMSLGKPVVATDYSGSCDFVTLANSLPVGYRLVELEQDYGPYRAGGHWADPDEEHAAEQMRRLVDEPGLAETMGEVAKRDITQYCGREAIARLLKGQIKRITG